ncbi:MAG: polysaccharide biosynthesis/export family protein [Pseudomonadota bacterium]
MTFTWFTGVLAGLVLLAVATAALAQSDYRIRSGDTLQIEVIDDPSLNRSVLVLPDGSFSFPFIGSLQARGSSIGQVRAQLAAGLAPNFANQPTVVVSVVSLAERAAAAGPAAVPTIDVYIMGEVGQAGRLDVEPGITILQVLAAAGGLTPFAAQSRIELHRTDRATGETSIFLYSRDGRGNGPRIGSGTRLAAGDVVFVPARRLFE